MAAIYESKVEFPVDATGSLFSRNVDNFGKDFCEHFTSFQSCQEGQSNLNKHG